MKKYLFFLTILLVGSCQNSSNSNVNDLSLRIIESFQYYDLLKDKTILVIPNAGCEGCITSAESFTIENFEISSKIAFVFTNISSIKILKGKLGAEVYFHQNVFIDSLNHFYSGEFINIYPVILYQKNDRVVKKVEVSPLNLSALDSLQSTIF